jgi:peptide/nickel transport system permease protein
LIDYGATLISTLRRWFDGDVGHSFIEFTHRHRGGGDCFICVFGALFAPWLAPHNPFDLATLELSNARLPPPGARVVQATSCWAPTTRGATFCRPSCMAPAFRWRRLGVGGVVGGGGRVVWFAGRVSGRLGGRLLMRLCDVMLSFPSILVALLIAGVGRAMFPNAHEGLAFGC